MIDVTKPIRVRMAPSPTGALHVGTVRTALFNYLFAKQYGGTFVLRIEDTDRERSEERFTKELIEGLAWMGIIWDEGPDGDLQEKGEYGPYHQSQRTDLYKNSLEKLIADKKAYWCYCTKEELDADKEEQRKDGHQAVIYRGPCRTLESAPEGISERVIRFATPETKGSFTDLIRSEINYDASLLGDFVIAKDIDEPLYNIANVIDDAAMEISHVIRGEDLLSSTPKQVLMYEALGLTPPIYAHLPLILGDDKKKLSKRKNEISLLQYRDAGYLPEALMNFLALLGWHDSGDNEFFTHDELVKAFSIDRVQKSGARFMTEKLHWLNREHLKKMDPKINAARLMPFLEKAGVTSTEDEAARFIVSEGYRGEILKEIAGEATWLGKGIAPTAEMLAGKDGEENAQTQLSYLLELLSTSSDIDAFDEALLPYAEEKGRRQVYWPLRIALSGAQKSPDPLTILRVVEKPEGIRRIEQAIALLKE